MKNVFRCASFAAVALVAMAIPAKADGIVLESYTGGRPDDVAKYVSPILDELAKKGFVAGYDAIGRRFEAGVSRPATATGGLPKTFKADVDRAKGEWARGKFDDALKILTPLVDAAHANPAAFVDDQGLRDALQDALIAMALSRKGQGDPDGMHQAFAELVRSYPRATPGPAYGPEANRAFEQVRRDLVDAHSGKLIVRVTDDTHVVYIDEELTGQGTTRRVGAPGEYRVVVKSPKQLSRMHRVVVHTGEETSATVDMGFDNALHIAPDWTGLAFPDASDREQLEGAYAAQFANLIDAHAVAVVGTEVVKGRTVIVGALINLKNGRDLRRASIAADSAPQVDRLRALARFLAGEDPGIGIEVLINGDGAGPPIPLTPPPVAALTAPTGPMPAEQPHAQRWKGWKWITGGATVGSLAGSVVLWAYNGKCSKPAPDQHLMCPDKYDNTAPAIALTAGTVALAGLTVYLWLTEAPKAPSKTAFIAPTRGGAMAGFATSF